MTEKSVSLLGKIAGFTEILAKDPQSTVFVSLCEAYRQLGMLDDALEIAEHGTQRLPGFSPGFVALGRILAQQGDLGKAAHAFERALSIEKDSVQALKGLARARYRQGYLDKARELLLRAQELSPDDPVVSKLLSALGKGENSSGSAPESRQGTTPEGGDTQAVSGEGSSFGSDVSSSDVSSPGGGSQLSTDPALQTSTMAQLYFQQGLYDEAASIYREILRKEPHNEEIRARLVEIRRLQAGKGFEDEAAPEDATRESATAVEARGKSDPQVVSEGQSDVDPNKDVIEIFQRWLNAIEQRRAHVC